MMRIKIGSNIKLATVLLLAMFFLLTGCRQTTVPEPEEVVETPEIEMPDEEEEPEVVEDNDAEEEMVEAQGRYVGFADSHSVEIELIDEAQPFMVFQLDESVRQQLEEEEYETGTEVSIKYLVMEQGQPMIMEIKEK